MEELMALMKKGGGSDGQYEIVEGVESVAQSDNTLVTVTSTQNKSPMYIYAETQGATYISFVEWCFNQYATNYAGMMRSRSSSGYDALAAEVGTMLNGVFINSIGNNSVVFSHHPSGNFTGTSIKYRVVFG